MLRWDTIIKCENVFSYSLKFSYKAKILRPIFWTQVTAQFLMSLQKAAEIFVIGDSIFAAWNNLMLVPEPLEHLTALHQLQILSGNPTYCCAGLLMAISSLLPHLLPKASECLHGWKVKFVSHFPGWIDNPTEVSNKKFYGTVIRKRSSAMVLYATCGQKTKLLCFQEHHFPPSSLCQEQLQQY